MKTPNMKINRRKFTALLSAGAGSITIPEAVFPAVKKLSRPVKLGLIADLHQDVMHDGLQRLESFISAMKMEKPDAIIQMGDFAYPNKKNEKVTSTFMEAHPRALHVLGNHDIDGGHSFNEVVKLWKMKGRYYTENIQGLNLVVLDGNEKPADHKGGYPSHLGKAQLDWLGEQLEKLDGPIVVISHQGLAGPWSVDNAAEVQKILKQHQDKILMTLNGHNHIDHIKKIGSIINFHVNSAAYQWVGGNFRHKSYPDEIHAKFPYIEYTCPYKDSLYTTLTIDPAAGRIGIKGKLSEWVGKSPVDVGKKMHPDLKDGNEVAPHIRTRTLKRLLESSDA